MARPLSDEKRSALLRAATEVVAALGVGAPTAQIARAAGVAEGTLFTYFQTKDDLLNQVYLDLKMSLRDAMLAGYPAGGTLLERSRHVWDRYIAWGTSNPMKRKAVGQLSVSDRITAESRQASTEAFSVIDQLIRELVARGPLKGHAPAFGGAVLGAIAETTIDFVLRDPASAETYTRLGFETYWRAISK